MYIVTSIDGLSDFSYKGQLNIISPMQGIWYKSIDGKIKWAGKSKVVEEITDYTIKFWDTKRNQFLVQKFGDKHLRCGTSVFAYPVPESMLKFMYYFQSIDKFKYFLIHLYQDYTPAVMGYKIYGFPEIASKYYIDCSEEVFWRYVSRLKLLR